MKVRCDGDGEGEDKGVDVRIRCVCDKLSQERKITRPQCNIIVEKRVGE